MIFKNLPIDLKKYIETYIYGCCEKCHFKNYYFNLKHDIYFYEYISIFHDLWEDFYLLRDPVKYKLICNFCFDLISDDLHYIYKPN